MTPSAEKSLDSDALKLAEMGYSQDMRRNFSMWSVLGVGFSLTNSWFAISAALVTGINSGGPLLCVYGLILMALLSICVGTSLSELASAFPNAGGQYFWATELASRRYANLASYTTGWFAWAGAGKLDCISSSGYYDYCCSSHSSAYHLALLHSLYLSKRCTSRSQRTGRSVSVITSRPVCRA